jgi:Protein of unknown function (DUF4236)
VGFRFRRSVKILPDIRLNIGKRGLSTSIGAHMTFGRTGTRPTVGLPGSGLSYTHLERPRQTAADAPAAGPLSLARGASHRSSGMGVRVEIRSIYLENRYVFGLHYLSRFTKHK